MFSRFCGALVPKSPLLIYANQMLPVPTTPLLIGKPWAAHSMTLYWWRKASLLLCTFLLSSNTVCILIFVGRIFWECPVSEDFRNYTFARHTTLSKDLRPMWVTPIAITQQPGKYYKHLLSDLSRYCHIRETLLTPSWVVDTSTIYIHRYAVGAFVAITCTNKSGWFQ